MKYKIKCEIINNRDKHFLKLSFQLEMKSLECFISVQSHIHVRLFATPWSAARQASLSITSVHQVSDAIQPSHPLLSPSPPAFNLSQHQGHVGKEGPHLTMTGASREFSRAAVPVWGFHEVGRGAQGASRVAPGKLGFNGRGEGNASLLSSHGRVSGLKTR